MENAALVLEGGAIRGIFSAGVLDFLMERKVQFPYVVSVSAGTCCAMSYLSGQLGRTRACMMPDPETRYYGLQQLRESGKLMDLRKIFFEYPYGRFPFDFSAYFASGTEHEIVVTDRADGLPRYLKESSDAYRLSLAAMASCSIPVLNAPVELDGRHDYDGGVGDSIPVGRALAKGYGKVVVVLTRRAGVYPRVGTKAQAAYRVFFRHYPQFRDALLSRPGPVSGPGDPSEPAGGPGPGLSDPPPGAGAAPPGEKPGAGRQLLPPRLHPDGGPLAGAPGIFEWEVETERTKLLGDAGEGASPAGGGSDEEQ